MTHTLKKEGESYRGFLLVKQTPIPELRLLLRELVHTDSGAEVMHLSCDDPENLFCLSFKTLPSSSNGAPHVLEHTVLCGSRKFPVKDPFFAMNRRSLNTFMNALTGSDFTCYPAASQVEKDFYNLLEVYLDAVFHPLLKEMSFLQEGHRLEFLKGDDPTTALQIKGIVYNEMKGSTSSADSLIWHTLLAHLVPDLPYAYNSGGTPEEIPSLSYRNLIDFYDTYYHPSRCLFFFYGNLPLEPHLDFLAEKTLKGVSRLPPLPSIPLQTRFSSPKRASFPYPLAETKELSKEFIHTFGWLTAPVRDQEEALALAILDSILMDTDASLLRKALLDSGLCVQAESYIDIEMSELPFFLFCRGCTEEAVSGLETLLIDALKRISKEGIPYANVEASMHQLEFSRLEIGGDQTPFGLTLFMRSALAKQHGCAPEQALVVHSLFKEIREKAKNPHYFSHLIEKYFLNNPHRVVFTFTPDLEYNTKEEEKEKARILSLEASLTDKDKAKIIAQTAELAAYQQAIEGQKLDCLPKVTLEDVPRHARDYPLLEKRVGSLQVYHSDVFTNHILYTDLVLDLPELPLEDLFYVQLFVQLLSEVGAGKRSYRQNLEAIHAHTGGLSAHTSLHIQATNPAHARPALHVRGKALARKTETYFELLLDMVQHPRFDEKKRIEELIKKSAHGMKNRLTRSGMRYASTLAASGLTLPGYIQELSHGISFYHQIQELAHHLPARLPALLEKFESLKHLLLRGAHPQLILNCDAAHFQAIEKMGFYGLSALQTLPTARWKGEASPVPITSQARIIPSPVAYTSFCLPTVSYSHPDAPALLVSTLLFENKILHHRIREQGGAYGAGTSYNPLWGHFSFYGYRDPHIARTLTTFTQALEEISRGDFDARDLEEAKLGIIQQIDSPMAPGSRGFSAYEWLRSGKTHAMRQAFRDRLLSLDSTHLQQAVQIHLLKQKEKGVAVVFAGEELIEKENRHLSRPLEIHRL